MIVNTNTPAEMTTVTETAPQIKVTTPIERVVEEAQVPKGPYYSIPELFALRDNAVQVETVLLTKEEMLPNNLRPKNKIVSPTSKPTTTIKGWQSFSEKEGAVLVPTDKVKSPKTLQLKAKAEESVPSEQIPANTASHFLTEKSTQQISSSTGLKAQLNLSIMSSPASQSKLKGQGSQDKMGTTSLAVTKPTVTSIQGWQTFARNRSENSDPATTPSAIAKPLLQDPQIPCKDVEIEAEEVRLIEAIRPTQDLIPEKVFIHSKGVEQAEEKKTDRTVHNSILSLVKSGQDARPGSRGSKDVLTHSKCDRLAKVLEGMTVSGSSGKMTSRKDVDITTCLSQEQSFEENTSRGVIVYEQLENYSSMSNLPGDKQPKNVGAPLDLANRPGLKASQWANDDDKVQFKDRPQPNFLVPHPLHSMGPSLVPNPPTSAYTLHPHHAAIAPPSFQGWTAPTEQTMQTMDRNTGEVIEWVRKTPTMIPTVIPTNILHTSLNALPSAGFVAPFSTFPQRLDLHSRHDSNAFPTTDVYFQNGGSNVKPAQSSKVVTLPATRRALSPVCSGENVQTRLQKRLDASIANRVSLARP
ncbi:hypothetical protein BGZ60DRAFT_395289 [Tricladium varicosporioides]|nr:hypothetical protein BGZ60DRAFT_395289 [Hymenoscyphus varicosporioides]